MPPPTAGANEHLAWAMLAEQPACPNARKMRERVLALRRVRATDALPWVESHPAL